MTKEQLWRKYADQNPQFESKGRFTVTTSGIRKLFEQTWDRAHEAGIENGRAIERAQKPKGGSSNPFEQMFGEKF